MQKDSNVFYINYSMDISGRDNSIDILRFIGLMLLVLAHVGPPNWLMQLRSFDVPLMVFVSGLTAARKEYTSYKGFILKRFKRLVLPVWIFLSIYLSIYTSIGSIFSNYFH